MAAVQNHPASQNLKDTVTNGEVRASPSLIHIFHANGALATQFLNFPALSS